MARAVLCLSLFYITYLTTEVFSFPTNIEDKNDAQGSALINCQDNALLKRMKIAKISYRCLDGSDSRIRSLTTDVNSIVKQIAKEFPKEEGVIIESADCKDPKKCETKSNGDVAPCQKDFSFDAILGECVPKSSGKKGPSRECKEGYSFDPEVERCLPISRVHTEKSERPIIDPVSHKCPSGYVYNPSVDRCLPIIKRPVSSGSPAGSPPGVSSLVNDKPERPINDEGQEAVGRQKCSKGMIYLSELDICVENENPTPHFKKEHAKQRRALTNIEEPHKKAEAVHSHPHVGRRKCASGQVYISEVDHCVDYNNSAEKTA